MGANDWRLKVCAATFARKTRVLSKSTGLLRYCRRYYFHWRSPEDVARTENRNEAREKGNRPDDFFFFLSFHFFVRKTTIFFQILALQRFSRRKERWKKKIHRLSLSQIRGRQFPVVRNDVLRNVFLLPKASLGDEAADGRKNVSGK